MSNETAHICQCNKCAVILIDQNSEIGAPEYQLTGCEVEMQYKEDDGGGFWVCPICESDDYLQDEITIKKYSL